MFHPAAQSPSMWISEAWAAAFFAVFVGSIVLICVGLGR